MIFARRTIQRRLTELRSVLDGAAVGALAKRANRPGRDRLAAFWEIAILHALSRLGILENEVNLTSGRQPDIAFSNGLTTFTADITTVSDEGLDDANPATTFGRLLEQAKVQLGLPMGGTELHIHQSTEKTGRGSKVRLRLPPRAKLPAFIKEVIVPQLKAQMEAKESVLAITIDDEVAGIELTIDPRRGPFNTRSHTAYAVPRSKDQNPVYNALKSKADQLKAAAGIKGVIVCDGHCTALSGRRTSWDEVEVRSIASEFLRQYRSMDFVLLISAREAQRSMMDARPRERQLHATLEMRPNDPNSERLDAFFRSLMGELPKPVMMPVNAALRAREPGYDIGFHGGFQVSGDRIRISSRELMEVLAGYRTLNDRGAKNVQAERKRPTEPSMAAQAFGYQLKEGRLPKAIKVIATGENDCDDWIEFEFEGPDPAISPLT